jgi:hypothetical protein
MPPPEQSSNNTYTCSCTCKQDSLDWQGRVTASTDDAEENPVAGSISLTGLKLDLDSQLVGVRFAGVNIPPGRTYRERLRAVHLGERRIRAALCSASAARRATTPRHSPRR